MNVSSLVEQSSSNFLNIVFMSFPYCVCYCFQVRRQRLRQSSRPAIRVGSIRFDCRQFGWLVIDKHQRTSTETFRIINKSFEIGDEVALRKWQDLHALIGHQIHSTEIAFGSDTVTMEILIRSWNSVKSCESNRRIMTHSRTTLEHETLSMGSEDHMTRS